jgi:predicted amidohydrolase YtcJ
VLEETARLGLTGVHDAGISMDDIRLYREAIDAGKFDLRLYGMIGGVGSTLNSMCDSGPILAYGDRLTVRSVKLYMDGALGSRGAALLEPYADDPTNTGLLQTAPEAFTEMVKSVIRCGFQVNTHAIGDRGNRVALQSYEEAIGELGLGPGRHRIEHAQIVNPADFVRFRELGLVASMQPTHATSDMYWAGDRLGEDRLVGAYSWHTFLENGVALAFGSDFPVEAVNPLLGIYSAATRQDAKGWPSGGWLPEQRLTRVQALRAFTIGAAYAAYQENEIGSLESGKLADFVVLSEDVMTIPPHEILQTDVVATFLGGRRIYGSPDM